MNFNELKFIKQSFILELEKSIAGQKTSFPFIRHTLASNPIVKENETFQVIVIGGSFYQKALMKKIGGNIRMISHMEGPQPQFLHKKVLFEFLEKHIDPHVKVIALNFAYPLHPATCQGKLDGTLVNGSKENSFDGLVGRVVGESIEEYFQQKHTRSLYVSCANDTICLLLSGLMYHPWNQLSAGVVGTGLNFALFPDEHTVVNLESAEFDKFERSEAGKIIDESSVSPGSALMEKEVSGAYLYHHFNIEAKKRGLLFDKITSTKSIDDYAKSEDEQIARLAKEILQHSASYVAIQVAGILDFCKRDLTFIMQGSLFWKGYKYRETVENTVLKLSPKYKAIFEKIERSDLYGAAKLVG